MTITEVLKKHTGRLMAVPGVVAVGEGERDGRPCIRLFVATANPTILKAIPAVLDGFPVIVEESGEFRARILRDPAA